MIYCFALASALITPATAICALWGHFACWLSPYPAWPGGCPAQSFQFPLRGWHLCVDFQFCGLQMQSVLLKPSIEKMELNKGNLKYMFSSLRGEGGKKICSHHKGSEKEDRTRGLTMPLKYWGHLEWVVWDLNEWGTWSPLGPAYRAI